MSNRTGVSRKSRDDRMGGSVGLRPTPGMPDGRTRSCIYRNLNMNWYRCALLLFVAFDTSGCFSPYTQAEMAASPAYYGDATRLEKVIKSGKLSQGEINTLWFDALLGSGNHPASDEVVRYLARHVGANIVGSSTGYFPLMLACMNSKNNAGIFRILLENGADVSARLRPATNSRTPEFERRYRPMAGSTALHFCAGESIPTADPKTSLNYYSQLNVDGFQVLLEHGADIGAKNKQGRTPLDSQAAARVVRDDYFRRVADMKSRNSFDFGKAIAIAGGVVVAESSSLSSEQKAEFIINYTTDVLTESGGTNTQNWANRELASRNSINERTGHPVSQREVKAYQHPQQVPPTPIPTSPRGLPEQAPRSQPSSDRSNETRPVPSQAWDCETQWRADKCGYRTVTYNINTIGRAYTGNDGAASEGQASRYENTSFEAGPPRDQNGLRADHEAGSTLNSPEAESAGAVVMGDVRPEALAICRPNKNNPDLWWCDGPRVKADQADLPLHRQLSDVGCGSADYRNQRLALDDRHYVFFCKYGRESYDTKIAEKYSLPGHILIKRKGYQCEKYKGGHCERVMSPR